MIKGYARILGVLMLLLAVTMLHAQVFNPAYLSKTPNQKKAKLKHRFSSIDTVFLDWNILDGRDITADTGIEWQQTKENQGFAFFAHGQDNLGMISVEYHYKEGKVDGCDLHFEVVDPDGQKMSGTTISHAKGITTIGITFDGTHYYAAYQKAINSGDRDLYVAKFTDKAELVWETRIGKRFGTSGPNLIKINADQQIVLFTQMYDKVGFDILSTDGKILDRKLVHFLNEFSPTSFMYNNEGNIVAIGSTRRYKGRETISSFVVFELDKNYQPVRYRELGTKFINLGLDVIQDEEGFYYFMANCENLKAPYGQRDNFTVIGKLDGELKLKKTKRIENKSTGLSLRLSLLAQNGLLFFQRSGERGYGFHLFRLDRDLELQQVYNVKGKFQNPNNLVVGEGFDFFVGGGSSKSWLVNLRLN